MKKSKSNWYSRLKKNVIGLLFGLALILLFFHLADFSWQEVISRILGDGWYILVWVILFTILYYLLSSLKWGYIIEETARTCCPKKIRISHLFHYVAVCYLFALILPQAVSDLGVKGMFLKKYHKIPFTIGTYSVLLDQFLNLTIGALFVVPTIGFLTKAIDLHQAVIFSLLMASVFFIMFWLFNSFLFSVSARFYTWGVRILYKIPFLEKHRPGEFPAAADFSIRPNTALKIISIGLIRHLVLALRLYVIILILGLHIDFRVLFLCSSSMLLMGLVTFIPAQLGIGELGWYGVLSICGVPGTEIVIFVVSMRFFSNLAILITSCMAWLVPRLIAFLTKKPIFIATIEE